MMTRHFQKREGSPRRRILAASLGCLLLQAHAPAWTFAPSSRPALRLLWEESTRERRERVACLGGTMTEDSVVVIGDKASPAGVLAAVMDEVKLGGIKDVFVGATHAAGG